MNYKNAFTRIGLNPIFQKLLGPFDVVELIEDEGSRPAEMSEAQVGT